MDLSLFASLLDPPILFFVFGLFAVLVGSNLDIPQQIVKFLSLYLLMAIGFKGGVALAATGITQVVVLSLVAAAIMSLAVPIWSYFLLRLRLKPFDAAAVAATYGSVSAVTFIAAGAFLNRVGLEFGGHMTVALVVMESPAIIMAVAIGNMVRKNLRPTAPEPAAGDLKPGHVLKEAFTDGAHLLLLGSLAIGAITGETGKKAMDPFIGSIFKGVLAFFMLEMGLLVGRRFRELREVGWFPVAFGIVAPIVNGIVAALLGKAFGLPPGDAVLLAVLSASASYIVVPAVVRYSIPEASPSLYFGMALGVTFPFNILLGIPLYYQVVLNLW